MNKTEIKKILKPLIKQCIKEVIFEDGTLSNIVSEVAMGLGSANVISESRQPNTAKPVEIDDRASENERKKVLREHKKRMLDAIGSSAYNGVDLFEGTTPAPAQQSGRQQSGPLSDVAPNDPGVDISSIPGMGAWSTLAGKLS